MQAVRIRPKVGDSESWYRSVIVDFQTDDELVLVMPGSKDIVTEDEEDGEGDADDELEAEEGGPMTVGDEDEIIPESIFDKGTAIEVEISFPDGIRRFTSVVRRLDLNYGGAMRIDWPTEGTRIQRRDFVRVEVTYRALVWFREEDDAPLQKVAGSTMDISAGGVRLNLPRPLAFDQRIEIQIEVPVLAERTLQGRVVHASEIEKRRGEEQRYWVAVEFVGVGESLRKEMTQMVFDIQREQMKRSLT